MDREQVVIGVDAGVAVLHGPWKLIRSAQATKLYNLEEDPTEQRNLAGEKPELVKQLEARVNPFFEMVAAVGQRRRGGNGRIQRGGAEE